MMGANAGGDQMPYQGSESKSRYLALALASRTVINSLQHFQSEGVADQQLERSIQDVLESLRETRDVNNLFGASPRQSPFAHYEQLLTLEEVTQALQGKNIVDKLAQIFVTANDEERKENVSEAVEFFYTLESRALYHYAQQVGSREA
jgi:hypothetical protein